MWPFKKPATQDPEPGDRYRGKPLDRLFETLVVDIIGYLPAERVAGIQTLNLQRVFNTEASEWRQVLRETLHLSPTFDIAVLDLWYMNREQLRAKGHDYPPEQFAREFTDRFFADDSKVDVWPGDSLEQAKWRIARAQALGRGASQ